MNGRDWKRRLAKAIEASGKSQRAVSLAADLGPGYVNAILNEDKDATVGHLLKVCAAADTSVLYVLAGLEITPETEEFLRLLTHVDEDIQRSVLSLLRHGQTPA